MQIIVGRKSAEFVLLVVLFVLLIDLEIIPPQYRHYSRHYTSAIRKKTPRENDSPQTVIFISYYFFKYNYYTFP